jgi:hypothetical protein
MVNGTVSINCTNTIIPAPLGDTCCGLYVNILGLSLQKLQDIEARLRRKEMDFIFVSETWHMNLPQLYSSTFFMVHSPEDYPRREIGHQNGGIALLCHPRIRHRMTVKRVDQYFIETIIDECRCTAVYFPPTFSMGRSESFIHQLHHADLIVGDFNCRWGAETGDSCSTHPRRRSIIASLMTQFGLQLNPSSSACSRNDLLLSRQSLEWFYTEVPEWQSDHGIMSFRLPRGFVAKQCSNPTQRYDLRHYQHKWVRWNIQHVWNSSAQPCLLMLRLGLNLVTENAEQFTNTRALQHVNILYAVFIQQIHQVAQRVLLANTAHPANRDTRRLFQSLLSEYRQPCAVRWFKIAQKGQAQTEIRSSGTTDVKEEALQHYRQLFSQVDQPEVPCPSPPLTIRPVHECPFSQDQVRVLYRKYPAGKSPGHDGLDSRLLKMLIESPSFLEATWLLYTVCWCLGTTPTEWNVSKLFLLPKDQSNPVVAKTRPVALTSILRRIFEKLILRSWIGLPWCKTHRLQAGFKYGHSTISQILCKAEGQIRRYIPAFLDLKNAYDSVPFHCLIETLQLKRCPAGDAHLVWTLFCNNPTSYLTLNGTLLDEPVHRRRGIFQGSILSPLLFSIVIDPLITEIEQQSHSWGALFFADDICLQGRSAMELQKLLDVCYAWARRLRLSWGINKCGIVGNSVISQRTFYLGPEVVPHVDKYKYLGALYKVNGFDWVETSRQFCAKARNLVWMLKMCGGEWPSLVKITLFRTFCRPCAEYLLPITLTWIERQGAQVKDLLPEYYEMYALAFKWMFGTRFAQVLQETLSGIDNPQFREICLRASLRRQLTRNIAHSALTEYYTEYRHFPLRYSHSLVGPLLSYSGLSLEYREYKAILEQHDLEAKWTNFKRWAGERNRLRQDGTLHVYVQGHTGKIDICLRISDEHLRCQALAWRFNKAFLRRDCRVCSTAFNRGHLKRCSLFSEEVLARFSPNNTALHEISLVFQTPEFCRQARRVSGILSHHRRCPQESHFGLLDFFLNTHDLARFQACWSHLDRCTVIRTVHDAL